MHSHQEIVLTRDTEAIQIPSGNPLTLPAGTKVLVTQKDADALGIAPTAAEAPVKTTVDGPLEEAVWNQLKTVFDPEIPVNVVDLGLIYDCQLLHPEEGVTKAIVKMTLTAPGCGMGPTIAADARGKILTLEGIDEAEVELVWDPAWNQSMISEAGRMKLGLV